MSHYFVALPILIPFIGAVLCLLCYRFPRIQKAVALLTTFILLSADIQLLTLVLPGNGLVMFLGNWPPPFGINLVADHLSGLLVAVAGLVGVAVMIYSLQDISKDEVRRGFYPSALLLLAGVNGAFLTGDIFNLYVWFEIILITSFSLLVINRDKHCLEGAVKYVAINLVKTVLFLSSVGMLYGMTGTLNMADLHFAVQDIFAYGDAGALHVIAIMLLLAFGIKAGIFPLYFWLPAAYHLPSSTIGALFAALLTKVGVYAMLRVFSIVIPIDQLEMLGLISIIAVATMLIAIMGAVAENHIRRILSFCLLSHIGSMLLGLAVFSITSFEGMVFYMVHHILTMACLFLIVGIIAELSGSNYLSDMGGLYKRAPYVVWLFFIPAIALAGLPPLSGFWGKFILAKAALEMEQYGLLAALLMTGFLTLYAMLRIWHAAVWQRQPEGMVVPVAPAIKLKLVAVVLLIIPIIYIGIQPEWLTSIARISAYNSMDPTGYVGLVLGGEQ